MSVLEYDPAAHKYLLDGKPAPGVTRIKDGGIPKGGIPEWYSRGVAEYVAQNLEEVRSWLDQPPVVTNKKTGRTDPAVVANLMRVPRANLEAAGDRGTKIHAAGEQLAETGAVEVTAHAAEIRHYAKWLHDWEIEPLLLETQVFKRDPLYHGTFDLYAQSKFINGGKPFLADLKSSNRPHGDTAVQLAAYAMADKYVDKKTGKDKLMPYIDYCVIVHITPGGINTHAVCENRAEVEEAFQWFKDAHTIYRNARARDKRLRAPLVRQPLNMYDTLKKEAA
jgi:hypothetical protein